MAFRGWDKIDHQVVGAPAIQSIAGSKGKEAAIDFWGASASIDVAAFIIILARGPDDRLYGSFGDQGPWVAVDELKLESAPTVDNHLGKASGAKLLDVAAIADGGKVWVKIDGSSNWRLLGGKAIGEAAIIARQCVFVRGVDDRLWAHPWEGQWTKVALMPTTPPAPGADTSAGFAVDDGYQLTAPPSASVWDQDTGGPHSQPFWQMGVAINAVAPGQQGSEIWSKVFDPRMRRWQNRWFRRGGRCKGTPTTVGVDGFPLFVRGLDDYLWSDWGGKWRCVDDKLKLTSSPSVAFEPKGSFPEENVMHIVARGEDGNAYYARWDHDDALTWPALAIGPDAQSDLMFPGEVLTPGRSISSRDGRFRFEYQTDGNLVLYRQTDGKPLWASGTVGTAPGVCIMQFDGNLVVYNAARQPVWSSDTWRSVGSRVLVQTDGNVVIYDGPNHPVWATNTVQ